MGAAQRSYETGCRLERQRLYGAAVSEWRRTVKLAQREGDWPTEHRAYNALATGYMALDRNRRAKRVAEHALRLARHRAPSISTLWSAWNLFVSSYRVADPQAFRRSAAIFMEVYEALGRPDEAGGEAAYVLAVLAYESEDFESAAHHFGVAQDAWSGLLFDQLVAEELQGMSELLGGLAERGTERLLKVYARAQDVFPPRYVIKTGSDVAAGLTMCGETESALDYAAQSLAGLVAHPGSLDPPEVGRLAAVVAAYGDPTPEKWDDELRRYTRQWLGALGCGTDAQYFLNLNAPTLTGSADWVDIPALRSTARLVERDLAAQRRGFDLAYYCEHVSNRLIALSAEDIRDLSYAAYFARLDARDLALPCGPAARELARVLAAGRAGADPGSTAPAAASLMRSLARMFDIYETMLARAGYEEALNTLIRARNRDLDADLVDRFVHLHFSEDIVPAQAGEEVNA